MTEIARVLLGASSWAGFRTKNRAKALKLPKKLSILTLYGFVLKRTLQFSMVASWNQFLFALMRTLHFHLCSHLCVLLHHRSYCESVCWNQCDGQGSHWKMNHRMNSASWYLAQWLPYWSLLGLLCMFLDLEPHQMGVGGCPVGDSSHAQTQWIKTTRRKLTFAVKQKTKNECRRTLLTSSLPFARVSVCMMKSSDNQPKEWDCSPLNVFSNLDCGRSQSCKKRANQSILSKRAARNCCRFHVFIGQIGPKDVQLAQFSHVGFHELKWIGNGADLNPKHGIGSNSSRMITWSFSCLRLLPCDIHGNNLKSRTEYFHDASDLVKPRMSFRLQLRHSLYKRINPNFSTICRHAGGTALRYFSVVQWFMLRRADKGAIYIAVVPAQRGH